MALIIDVEDPSAAEVRALLQRHLAFAREVNPYSVCMTLALDTARRV